MRRRLIGAYTSSVISISLVLLLVGVATLLVVNAGKVSDYFKESMQMSVILSQDATDEDAAALNASIQTQPFIHSSRLVTREEGAAELKAMLGEDFLSVFETSPVPVSIDVTLRADYVSPDSVAVVTSLLGADPSVDEVVYQTGLVEALSSNLSKISFVLGIFILLLLFVSYVLIGNTVRINAYSQRFTIHTMKLVGATRGFIRRPFLVRSIWQGLVSAILALMLLAGVLYALYRSFPELFTIMGPEILAVSAAAVVVTGVVICLVSTYFVIGRLISLEKDELYG